MNQQICPIFHAENNLSKFQFNFAHFIGPILTMLCNSRRRAEKKNCLCGYKKANKQTYIGILYAS
jgi:hypothetical protein